MLIDKEKAKKKLWRIPEKLLLGTAIAGGSIGIFAGMKCWHHKTKHLQFSIGIPVIMALQILCYIIIFL